MAAGAASGNDITSSAFSNYIYINLIAVFALFLIHRSLFSQFSTHDFAHFLCHSPLRSSARVFCQNRLVHKHFPDYSTFILLKKCGLSVKWYDCVMLSLELSPCSIPGAVRSILATLTLRTKNDQRVPASELNGRCSASQSELYSLKM